MIDFIIILLMTVILAGAGIAGIFYFAKDLKKDEKLLKNKK